MKRIPTLGGALLCAIALAALMVVAAHAGTTQSLQAGTAAAGPQAHRAGPRSGLATITVNTTKPDLTAGDNLCSLPKAIINANTDSQQYTDCAAGGTSNLIVLGSQGLGLHYPITMPYGNVETYGLTGLPPITGTITISGYGSTIERTAGSAQAFRLLLVEQKAALTLNEVTIQGGLLVTDTMGGGILNLGTLALDHSIVFSNTAGAAAGFGGGISNGLGEIAGPRAGVAKKAGVEGIFPEGTLTLSHSQVLSNTANMGGGVGQFASTMVATDTTFSYNQADTGGGMFSIASGRSVTTTLDGCTFSDNSTTGDGSGGAGFANEASVDMTARLIVSGTTFSDNTATGSGDEGGIGGGILSAAIQNGAATYVTLTNSTVANNYALDGAGIANANRDGTVGAAHAYLFLVGSTLSGNWATASGSQTGIGGGILNWDASAAMLNSTLSNNAAIGNPDSQNGLGGAIANVSFLGSTVLVEASTIAGNNAGGGGGVANLYWASTAGAGAATFRSAHSLVASNTDLAGSPNCLNSIGAGASTSAALASLGYNLESANTCNFNATGDLTDTLPMIRSLADNGGPTLTMALIPGSRAINHIPPALCLISVRPTRRGTPPGPRLRCRSLRRAVPLHQPACALVGPAGAALLAPAFGQALAHPGAS